MKFMSDSLNKVGSPKREYRRLSHVLVVVLTVFAMMSSCAVPSDGTEEPVNGEHEEAVECDGSDGTYTCPGLSEHTISIRDVPDNIGPYMLPVSPEREQELFNAEKEDIGCVFLVVGDLVFYDEDQNIVRDFSNSPVTISFSLTGDDFAAFENCRESLIEQQLILDPEEVEYQPIYYSDKWMPFDEYTVEEGNTISVVITSWGDQPLGGGTRP